MYKVCIVGGGQIGSRHLQGLAPINVSTEVFVVDPSQESLEVARQRFQEVIKDPSFIEDVHYIQDIALLPTDLDLCIVATNSDVRYGIMDYLTSSYKIRNYVLEKVVFQSPEQFGTILRRIDAQRGKAWVNCARRMYPGYQELKQRLKGENNLSIELITDWDWGLGCNAIHYLDLLAYFSDESNLAIDSSCLEPRVYSSKRGNYVEFCGSITGRVRGGRIILTSRVGKKGTSRLVFRTDNITASVNEVGQEVELSSNDPAVNKTQTLPFECRFQSQLTYQFVQDILMSGSCSLPTLKESTLIHKPLLEAFMGHLNQYGDKYYDHCPIT